MDDNPTLIETMALAMWREREKNFPQRVKHGPDQLDMATGAWAMMLAQARAGLQSLRSPTDQQLGNRFSTAARRQWDDMVNAALSQSEQQSEAVLKGN